MTWFAATLDTSITIQEAGAVDGKSKSSFPFALLLVRQEGTKSQLLSALDASYLVSFFILLDSTSSSAEHIHTGRARARFLTRISLHLANTSSSKHCPTIMVTNSRPRHSKTTSTCNEAHELGSRKWRANCRIQRLHYRWHWY